MSGNHDNQQSQFGEQGRTDEHTAGQRPVPGLVMPEEKIIAAVPLPLRRLGGALLLRVCPAKKVCTNTRCWVQPFCKCARTDWAIARQSERRVWICLAACGGVVLAIALFRAMAAG